MSDKTFHIETLGCQMNERDSETIAGMLIQSGYVPVRDCLAPGMDADCSLDTLRRAADLIVVNTCSVRENADNRFFGILGQLKRYKNENPETLVAIGGCMMQQEHIVERIRQTFSWVDIVFGTHSIHELPLLLSNARTERVRQISVPDDGGEIVEGLPSKRVYPFKAFVNITFGCNNFCTYCIVPYTRGRERSRSPESIYNEVTELCRDGVKEITLLGQNVNSYLSESCLGQHVDFPGLIHMLDTVPGLSRLRFMTSHPKDLSEGLIRAFSECRSLCPSIHLPVQAGSSRVLTRMNRGYTKETYLSLVSRLRAEKPDIVLTTDLIVGFPGETDVDFEDTMDVIAQARFDAAFTFMFSPRQGTPAANYSDQVPDEIKRERFSRMVDAQNAISLEKNKACVGRIEPVLIEGESKTDKTALAGRTAGGKLVNIRQDAPELPGAVLQPARAGNSLDACIGQILDVRLLEANTFSFTGRFV